PPAARADSEMHLILYRGAAGAQMAAQYRDAVAAPATPPAVATPRRVSPALDLTRLLPAQYVAAAQAELAAGRWDGKPRWGLNLSETARLIAYDAYRNQAYTNWYFAHWRPSARIRGGWPSEAQAMGPGYDEFTLLNRRRVDYELAHQAQELAAAPIRGPAAFIVPPGELAAQAAMEQGVDPRGLWRLGGADAQGARRMTRLADAPYMIFVPLEQQARAARPPTPAG
ncbi:MAG: hypothetical protein JWM33_1489, partial [Caulobacteraceae bacterium]|nr:hypothetical protein [Caulobacteraceae bacterium]